MSKTDLKHKRKYKVAVAVPRAKVVDGYPVSLKNFEGIDFFVFWDGTVWQVTEGRTGYAMGLSTALTRQEAIDQAQKFLDDRGYKALGEMRLLKPPVDSLPPY